MADISTFDNFFDNIAHSYSQREPFRIYLADVLPKKWQNLDGYSSPQGKSSTLTPENIWQNFGVLPSPYGNKSIK